MIYTLLAEPAGRVYQNVLDYAVRECSFLILVLRGSLDVDPTALNVLERLNSQLISNGQLSEWPGTRLIDHTANVFSFRYGAECAAELKSATSALFSWQQPHLPEDPCLLRADGTPWLITISHERDAYFELSTSECKNLVSAVSSLAPMLRLERENPVTHDLKYEQIGPVSRAEAQANLGSGDHQLMARTIIALGLHDHDWRWVQNRCLQLISHDNEVVVSAAILGLAHTARVNRAIDRDLVVPALNALAADARYRGRVEDALDDIRMFVREGEDKD